MMKKRYLIFVLAMLIVACEQQEFLTCPDNVTKVVDLANCPTVMPECPECSDNNNCTRDLCSRNTNYTCVYEEFSPCDGNGICEEGEYPWSTDCPDVCDDGDECTEDIYNYELGRCISDDIVPCCGNGKCESGEVWAYCPSDCEQMVDIGITRQAKKFQHFPDATNPDLTGTDYIYLAVYYSIKNIGIDTEEELNYKKKNGFYFDPFNFKLEDSNGNLYDVEYDSDFLDEWLDYTILEKGTSSSGAVLFIVPLTESEFRLIAYDKYGNRLDSADLS